jgi:folate-binding protein YgfZ
LLGHQIDVTRADLLGTTDAVQLWVPVDAIEPIGNALREAVGCVGGFSRLEDARVRAGMPRFGIDIGPDTIPLETHLAHMINFDKGCYLGQEVIARVDSRGAVARHLVGLLASHRLEVGAEIRAAGGAKILGAVTSVVRRDDGTWFALGWVKRGYQDAGTEVAVAQVSASVVALPPAP